MPETSTYVQTDRPSLRRSRLALAALRTVLEEMAERFDSDEGELCERALMRIAVLADELETLDVHASTHHRRPALACTVGEVCQAARQLLPRALRDRVLISAEQADEQILIDDAELIRGLRDLAETMFARGANAVLLNAHFEESEAVFALIDDRQGPAPSRNDGSPNAEWLLRDIAGVHGSVTPIGSAQDPQGVIVRVPVTVLTTTGTANENVEATA